MIFSTINIHEGVKKMPIWLIDILYVLLGLVIGLVIGFFVSKKLFTKQLEANPPMIEAMMSSMGRKPSQKQVRQVMQQMNRYR